jgi:glycosyltransferase involved in cell wall biosynthesis
VHQVTPGIRIGLYAHRVAASDVTGVGRYVRELVCALDGVVRADALTLVSAPEAAPPNWIPRDVQLQVVPWRRRPVQAAWCLGLGPRLEQAVGELDVVHVLHPFPPVSTYAPLVVTVPDLFPLERPEWFPHSERWCYRRSLELVRARASRIVVPSAHVADRLTALIDVPAARVEVVPHGVNGTFTEPVSDGEIETCCRRFGVDRGRFAVCVGAVTTRKNLITVVRAVSEPGSIDVPLLLIGGDGHGASAVDAEIAALDGRGRAVRTGYLPDRDVAALVRGAAALVHPALDEGFGMVPLEAMAVGTPVVAARVGSVPEVVREAGILVERPTEPSAWGAALGEVFASGRRRDELSAAGRSRAAAFSWERTAHTMLELYRDAARR